MRKKGSRYCFRMFWLIPCSLKGGKKKWLSLACELEHGCF